MSPVSKFVRFGLLATIGLLSLSACSTPLAPASAADGDTTRTLSVSGSGVAYGTPDIATVQIGVQSRNTDAAAAVADNTTRMNAVTAAIKELGVADVDIQTTNFSIYPQQDYDPQTGQPTGTTTYVVDNSVNITLRDLTQVGAVLGRVAEAGANNIYGISFGVSDPAALEAEARAKAMADAKARAEQLAQAAGVTLDVHITISEYMGGAGPIYADSKVAMVGGGGAPVPVSTGQLQISLSVSVVYGIK